MKKPALYALCAVLLSACGGLHPPHSGEVPDDTEDSARTLASLTVRLSAREASQSLGQSASLRHLASTAPTAPVTVTVAVKVGTPGSKYAGQKRAFLGWKLNGKFFPGELTGMTAGSYTLALKNPDGTDAVKAKTGTLSVSLPLASGSLTTSRSRSTAYAAVSSGVCAVASSSLTLPNGTPAPFGSETAPLVVCESGVTYSPTPSPQPGGYELSDMTQASSFTTHAGKFGALVTFSQTPAKLAVLWTKFQFQQAEDCGAGDASGVGASGVWQAVSSTPNTRQFFTPADQQAMSQEHYGLAYQFAFKDEGTANGETLLREGLLCYAPS